MESTWRQRWSNCSVTGEIQTAPFHTGVAMMLDNTRRSDRITVSVPIEVSGSDATGQYFFDRTFTLVINRHGATLVLERKLMPEQNLTVRNLQNQKETEVGVVGFIARHEKGDVYGVMFINPRENIWEIDFPPLSESADAAMRLVMECIGCRKRQVSYLNELESEVFRAGGALRRRCEKCRDSTLWKESFGPEPEPEPEPQAQASVPAPSGYAASQEHIVSSHAWDGAIKSEVPPPTQRPKGINERKHVRSKMQIPVCVRRMRSGTEEWGTQEVVELTDDCSRGGFSFQTYERFEVGDDVEACMPYNASGANIFVPARIANARKQQDGRYRYGVGYVRQTYGR